MSSSREIIVSKDFALSPGPRYKHQGPHSGEAFRESLLAPALSKPGGVVVNLDGTSGYGSSFIDEAFGGLIRAGISSVDLKQRLKIISNDDPILITDVWQAVSDAEKRLVR